MLLGAKQFSDLLSYCTLINILIFVCREINVYQYQGLAFILLTVNSSDILTKYPWFSLRPLLDESLLNRVHKAGSQTRPGIALHNIAQHLLVHHGRISRLINK